MTVTWSELLAETRSRLEAGRDDNPGYHARLITEEALGLDGAGFLGALGEPATIRGVAKLDAMVARRLKGEPIQYVIGHWPFRRLDLFIDSRVLIPRPETEIVAGVAIDRAAQAGGAPLVIDLGTGSGAIGLSIASELEGSAVWLTDQSTDAIDVARANLAGVGPGAANVRIAEGDWFEALPIELRGAVDVIVSNPPYVATTDELGDEVALWEPMSALFAGERGLDHLIRIIEESPEWLRPGGSLVLELAPRQSRTVATLCRQRFSTVEVVKDMAGLDRVVWAC